MRWLKFSTADGTAYGILEGERVLEVKGDPFSGYEKTSRVHALNDVKIEVPVEPRTFYCAGNNYLSLVIQSANLRDVEPNIPQTLYLGFGVLDALIAHNEPVVLPP